MNYWELTPFAEQLQETLRIPSSYAPPPPDPFPVAQTTAPQFISAAINYTDILPSDRKPDWLIWLEQHQTEVLIGAGALFAVAIFAGGKNRR